MRARLTSLICGMALALSCTTAAPQGTAAGAVPEVRVGGKVVRLPVPAGYERIYPSPPDLARWAEKTVAATNRILAAYLPEEEVAKSRAGEKPSLARYMRAEVERDAEYADFPREALQEGVAELKAQQGELLRTVSEVAELEASRTAAGGLPAERLGQPQFVGAAGEGPDYYVFTTIVTAPPSDGAQAGAAETLAAVGLVRVQNRLVLLGAFQPKTADADVESIGKAVVEWAEAIVAANSPMAATQ